jgi:hypothetical protein
MTEIEMEQHVNRLGIKEIGELSRLINRKKIEINEQLINTLPDELKNKYRQIAVEIASQGSCDFVVFPNVGININKIEREKYYKKARKILQPVVKKWSKFGVVLSSISFLPIINGQIHAHFKVR